MVQKVFSKVDTQQFSKGSMLRTLEELMACLYRDLRLSVPLIVSLILGDKGENVEVISFQWANSNNQSVLKFMNKRLYIISMP